MKRWQFYTAVCMGVTCLVLSTALVAMVYRNRQIQKQIQEHQVRINSGILGQQAQQITGNIIQEMAAVAATNNRMRDLLKQHGYTLQQESPTTRETPTTPESSAETAAPGEEE